MSHEDQAPSDPSRSPRSRLIHLARNDLGELLATPVDLSAPSFPPLEFPRLPLSLHCWLTGLGAEFRRRHDRCLATLLVLDYRMGFWVQPVIPSQSCGEEGSAWTLDWGHQVLPPDHRIAGSFQMRVARDLNEAMETVPQFDGLHIVQTLQGQQSIAYCFLHIDGETSVLPVDQAMEDDWAIALDHAIEWMTFD